jgi:3-dehydroquinate dehydratase / shikimate dehydrogenase
MNNGKICVSICAETADSLYECLRAAKKSADVIELRFDCLNPSELENHNLEKLESGIDEIIGSSRHKPMLSTFRPKEQGGKRDLTKHERQNFWSVGFDRQLADLEEDLIVESLDWPLEKRICSFHAFSGSPSDPEKIYNRLAATKADIIKIAVQANDIVDSIPIWKLLERASNEDKPFIPIAMGEAGKWTRILGLAHGAFMTYASLDTGAETAPGQISAADMNDVFRVKELDETTEVFGVIAADTSYSVSPLLQNVAFKANKLNSVFVPLQVADLDAFFTRMVSPNTREIDLNFKGFAVTNPHKQSIMRHLDVIDETAMRIGAVNTVKIEDGRFYGYNTDAEGFIQPLRNVYGELAGARVAVFGAGGAARACIYALQLEGANVTLLARNAEKGKLLAEEFGIAYREPPSDPQPLSSDFDIIINTTPVGTAGQSADLSILRAEQIAGIKLLYDLVYNPSETLLIRQAREAGVQTIGGIEMLIAQGAKQFEIWTGAIAPIDAMRSAVQGRLEI